MISLTWRGKVANPRANLPGTLILATSMMTRELKAHEYGKDANSVGVYSGSVLHGNLHTRVSGYTVTRHVDRESGPDSLGSYTRDKPSIGLITSRSIPSREEI